MDEKIKQLKAKLEADAKLGGKLFSRETPEEAQAVMKEAGLDFSLEEIKQLRELIIRAMEKGSEGELSEKELEDVAGGVVVTAAGVAAVGTLLAGTGGLLVGVAAVGTAGVGAAAFAHGATGGRW